MAAACGALGCNGMCVYKGDCQEDSAGQSLLELPGPHSSFTCLEAMQLRLHAVIARSGHCEQIDSSLPMLPQQLQQR